MGPSMGNAKAGATAHRGAGPNTGIAATSPGTPRLLGFSQTRVWRANNRAAGRSVQLIGTAFDLQKVAAIPAEDHDVPLGRILTESGLRTLSAGE